MTTDEKLKLLQLLIQLKTEGGNSLELQKQIDSNLIEILKSLEID